MAGRASKATVDTGVGGDIAVELKVPGTVDEDGDGEVAEKKVLRNQFNFSERASQTFNQTIKVPPTPQHFSLRLSDPFILSLLLLL